MCICLHFYLVVILGFDVFYPFSVQAAVSVKALEKQLQQKKDSDPIMAGILEEVRQHCLSALEVQCTT